MRTRKLIKFATLLNHTPLAVAGKGNAYRPAFKAMEKPDFTLVRMTGYCDPGFYNSFLAIYTKSHN